jgi:transposase-like protein
MEQALREGLSQGIMDLGRLMVATAALWVQQAMELEREAFLQRPWGQRPPTAQGHANGYERRTVATAEGPLTVAVPQVRNTSEPFRPQILELLKHRTDSLEVLAIRMYVGGLSYADIAAVFAQELKVPNMSETVVRGLCASLQGEYERFVQRDLSAVDLVYLFLDGTYLRLDRGRRSKEAVLVARGYTRAGRSVLLGLAVGPRESYEAWKTFLSRLRDRGLPERRCW